MTAIALNRLTQGVAMLSTTSRQVQMSCQAHAQQTSSARERIRTSITHIMAATQAPKHRNMWTTGCVPQRLGSAHPKRSVHRIALRIHPMRTRRTFKDDGIRSAVSRLWRRGGASGGSRGGLGRLLLHGLAERLSCAEATRASDDEAKRGGEFGLRPRCT